MIEERDCEHCKHYVLTNIKGLEVRACEKWNCEYEPEEKKYGKKTTDS